MSKHSKTAIIYPGVELGKNVTIEDYCIVGIPAKGCDCKKTIIGDDSVIRAGSYIYAGNVIGNNFYTGNKVNIRELNVIGDNVSIGTLSVIEHHVKIGNGVRIHSQVFVPEFTTLEENSWLGPKVVMTNARYPNHPNVKKELLGAHIHKNAKIGANSTLLPGVIVGEGSLIGAGSLVTKDIQAGVIAMGNPARLVRKIDY